MNRTKASKSSTKNTTTSQRRLQRGEIEVGFDTLRSSSLQGGREGWYCIECGNVRYAGMLSHVARQGRHV